MTDLHAYYEVDALWDREKYVTGYERDRLMAGLDFIPADAKSLIDIGCGNGAFISFAETARPDIDMLGVDPSGSAIRQKWCRSDVIQGEATKLPFGDRSFDVVCSMAVLEHIPDSGIGNSLAEIMRLSRKYILLNLPYREQRARINCPSCNCSFDPHLHLRSYDDARIAGLFPGFVERKRLVLSAPELIVPYTLQRVLKREFSASRYPNAICPQCGYTANKPYMPKAKPAAPTSPSLARRLWNSQPSISVVREIYVLFEET